MPPLLLALLPALISALSSGAMAAASKASVDKMNRYNNPRAQLQRLNAAGLPFAAFAAGQAGQQSTLPDVSGIGMAGQALGNYFTDRNQMAMYDSILQDVRRKGMDNDLFGEEWKFGMEDAEGYMKGSNAYNKAKLTMNLHEFQTAIQRNASTMSSLDAALKEAQFNDGSMTKAAEAALKKVLLEVDILELDKGRKGQENINLMNFSKAKNKLIDTMSKGGLNFVEALTLLFLESKL